MSHWTKKTGVVAAALFGVCAMALSASAQAAGQERNVTTLQEMGETVKLHVSGRVQMDYVWRSKELVTFTDRVDVLGRIESENTVEGVVAVRLDAELQDKISAVVEVGTLRVDDIGLGGFIREFGGVEGHPIFLREAKVTLGEFLTPTLSAELGISNWLFDVRGRGSAFAFDPRHSQSFERNWGVTETSALATFGKGDDPAEQFPVGAVFRYTREALVFEVVALPVVVEGGNTSRDEALYAVDLWYDLPGMGQGSRVGALFAATALGDLGPMVDDDDTAVYTFGGGTTLRLMDGALEVYGEIYAQRGDAGQDAAGDTIDAKGMAFQVGAEYRLPQNPMNLWFGVNYTSVSGDDDTAPDDKVDSFMSYENVNDLMILEDMYFGVDIDTNYNAVKLMGGFWQSIGGVQDNLEIKLIVGLVTTDKDVTTTGGQRDDELGTEYDIQARWHLSKQASLHMAYALLTHAELLDEAMRALGGPAVEAADETASLFVLGMDVKF